MVAREKKKANDALQLEGFQSKFMAVVLFGIFYTLIGDICIQFIIEKLQVCIPSWPVGIV